MAALKLTACMKVVAKMGEMDQEALLERLDRYTADGVPKDRAQVMAAADSLAELQDERREFMAMLRQQHPDLFVVSNAIPEDQDVDPDQPDVTIEELRSYISESNSPSIEGYMPPDWGYVAEQARRLGLDDLAEYAASGDVMRPSVGTALDLINQQDIKRGAGRSEEEIAASRADGWTIADNDLPSREAAERIVKLRTKGNSAVRPMAAWQDAEVRVVESDNPGFWAIETRRAGIKRSAARDITRSRKRQPSEVFGREIAPAAIRAYKSLSAGAKSIVDGWNVNWSMGQGRLRNSKDFDEVVKAYEPVREKLRQVYGSTVPAFRGEKQDGTESTDDRFLFSWTPMRDIAAGFAVNRRYGMPAEIPQSKVDEQIEAYRKTGIARLNGYKFVRKDPGDYEPDGPDYYYIYQGGEMITDGDDIARALQQEKDERDAWISELRDGGKLYAGNIPVDSVAFIPVGANLRQPEFVAEYNPRKDAVGEIRLSTKRNELGFHSALERGIEGMQTKSALPGAWMAQIKGLVNKGQVSDGEISRSGLIDYLGLVDGKIAKPDVLRFVNWANEVDSSGVAKPGDIIEQVKDFFDGWKAPSEAFDAVVDSGVVPALDYDQVVEAIVERIPVDVMDMLSSQGISTNDFARNPKVLLGKLPSDPGLSVAVDGLVDALSRGGALLRARLDSAYQAGLDLELLPALRASDLKTGVASGFFLPPLGPGAPDVRGGRGGIEFGGARPGAEDGSVSVLGVGRERGAAVAANFGDFHEQIVAQRDGDSEEITDAMREKVSTEGLPLFSRKRDVTDTPEFKRWFSGSQVVDENGLPKVQYHSTNSTDNFGVFRTDRELGAHFGTERQANERGGGFVYPVYLSIKNPLRLEDKGDFHAGNVLLQLRRMGMITRQQAADMSSDVRPIQEIIESAGYDGVVYLNRNEIPGVFGEDGVSGDDLSEMTDQEVIEMFGDDAQDSWIAFRPEQIKSAIGNNGDFDPANPDIRRSTGRTSTGASWDSPSASKFDDLVYKFQDKNIETKRVVEAIKDASGAIADDLNVYLQEELYHGRAAKRTEDFVNMELNPLVEQLAKDGLKLEDLEEFLHARHAPEANEVIARRNPGVAGLQDGGSGMKTADALNYMATLPADLKQKLETAAAKVDAIIGKTRQLYVDYELESQDTVDGWGRVFQHYIPLQREDKDGKPGLGQGFSVKGKETKGRTGSTRKVVDILANIAMQRERAIVRGEKNRVSQALLGLAAANPNEGFWKVDEVPTEKVYNPDTGLVEDRIDPMFKSRENAVVSKVKGADGKVKEHAVIFNEEDERALRMAKALKNLDADKLEGMLGVSAQITRYFASVNTQYNPVFGVVNLVRDVQGAILNLSSTQLAGDEAKIAKNTMSALRGIYSDARAARKGNSPSSAWAKLWDEFQEVGGQTGYRDLFKTSADRADAIKKTLDPDAWADTKLGKIFTANGALKVPMAQAKRGAGWIFDWLSDYNLAMENGVRLAAYKAGLERGLSKEQAASAAKNLTVNFNRKGQVSQQAGAMYAFFNASLQGTARIFQTIFEMEPGKPKTIRLSPMGKKVIYGGVLLGSIQAMALAAAGFNDEDPPQFARERSLIIPLMNGKYITIPMPLGFHVIPNIGRITTEFVLSGFRDPHERALQLVSLFADTFNPIGNAGLSMQTLAPTALDPLVALTENRDWTGKPIARESSNPAVPGHALARDTATSLSKLLSEAINTASGGNKYVAGVFSPTPDQIDYLLGQLTGGVGRELSKVEQSSLAVARGEDLPTFKMPLVGRFVGDAKQQASEGSAFYANTDRINRLETEIKGLQKDGKYAEAAELRRTNSDAYLIAVANQAERQIQKLRSEKRKLIKNNAPREQVRAIEERITAVMARLNRAAERLKEQQGN